MNQFERDLAMQCEVRDALLKPRFYGDFSVEGRFVFLDRGPLATLLQKRCAADTVAQGHNGAALFIEEKIVRWPGYVYRCFCLETDSCTKPGHESPGWMRYARADFLLYCFMRPDHLRWFLIDFPALKRWFEIYETTLKTFGPLPQFNGTAGRLASIEQICAEVWHRDGMIFPDPANPAQMALFPDLVQPALLIPAPQLVLA